MDKELALAIEFEKAPKKLQQVSQAHYENVKNLAKLKAAVEEGQRAVLEAQKAYDESAKELRAELKSWTPEA